MRGHSDTVVVSARSIGIGGCWCLIYFFFKERRTVMIYGSHIDLQVDRRTQFFSVSVPTIIHTLDVPGPVHHSFQIRLSYILKVYI